MFAPGGPSRATVTGTDRGPSDRETARIRQPQAGALPPLNLRLGSGFPGPRQDWPPCPSAPATVQRAGASATQAEPDPGSHLASVQPTTLNLIDDAYFGMWRRDVQPTESIPDTVLLIQKIRINPAQAIHWPLTHLFQDPLVKW